jgi:hypothetical protein
MWTVDKLKKYDYIARHWYEDRLYSQIMRHFLSFFIAKMLDKKHIHWPYQDKEINDTFLKIFDKDLIIDQEGTFENVMNLVHQEKKCVTIPDQDLVGPFNINEIFTEANVELMRRAYKYSTNTRKFINNNKCINIAVHIRRGDISTMPFCDRYTELDFFTKYIQLIGDLLGDKAHFHIYSDSKIKLDVDSSVSGFNLYYHYSDDLLSSVYDMICADIFIMSIGSNMSYFAGLLSKGIVFFDERKLVKCFNNMYNIYWSDYRGFIHKEEEFISKIKDIYS